MKLYAYIAAAILLASLLGYGVHVVKKANRAEAAEARAEAAEKGRAADMAEIVKRLDEDAKERRAFNDKLDGINKRFDNIKVNLPPAAALVQNHEVPSVEGKCIAPTVGPSFVGVWNESSKSINPTSTAH